MRNFQRIFPSALIIAGVFLFAGCGLNQTPAEHISRAKDYMGKGEFQAALIELTNAAQKDPNSVEGRWLLAKVRISMGDGASAEKEIKKAKELGLNRASAQATLVKAILLQGDLDRVLAETSQPMPDIASADQATLLGLRGQAFIARGQLEQAQQALEQALQIKSDSLEALVGMTALHGLQRHYDVARSWVEKALKADPASADAWGALGDLELAQGRLAEAEKAYDSAIKHRATPYFEQAKRAQVRTQLKKYQEASADIKALQAAGLKNHPYVNYIAGLNYFAQKNYRDAVTAFQASFEANPDYLPNRIYLATTHHLLGNTAQALSHAQQIFAAAPRSRAARNLLGSILISRAEYDGAKEILQKTLAKSPNDPRALGMMATIAMLERDAAKGLEYAKKLVALEPNSKSAQNMLMMAKLMAGEALDQTISQAGEKAAAAGDDYTREFMLALAAFRDGKLKEALESAQALHARYPDKVDPPKLMAAVYLAAGQWDKAKVEFEKVLKLKPNEPSAVKSLAKIEARAGNTQRARSLLQALVKEQPGDEEAALLLAEAEASMGNQSAAMGVLEQALKHNPNALTARAKLAEGYLRAGNSSKALETTRELSSEQIQKQPALLELRGKAQMLAGNAAAARSTFEQWTKVVPDSAPAHFYYSNSLSRTGDAVRARKELEHSVKLGPNYLPARLGEIKMFMLYREIEKAKKALTKLRQDFGGRAEVLALEGSFALGTGDYATATQRLSEAYKSKPDTDLTLLLSRAYFVQKKPDQGLNIMQAWLKDHPRDIPVLLQLAQDYMALGKEEDARVTYEKVIKAYPNHVLTLNNLAWLNRNSDLKKAIAYAEQAHLLAPQAGYVLDTLGTLRLKNGDVARGHELILQAAERAPGNQEIQLHLGQVLVQQKRYSQARDVLSAVVKKVPGTRTAKEGQALLDSIQSVRP